MGRKKKCQFNIMNWQNQLNQGYSIDSIARIASMNSKDKSHSFLYYKQRLLDLIESGELRA